MDIDQRVVFSREGRPALVAALHKLDALSLQLCEGDAQHAAEVAAQVRAGQKVQVRSVNVVLLIREGAQEDVQPVFTATQEATA